MRAFRIRRFSRHHRSNPVVRRLAGVCEKFLNGYYNEGFFDFAENGEEKVVNILSPSFALDVGANYGEWTLAVLRQNPQALVACFEIVPETARVLRARLADRANVHIYDLGLSSRAGEATVYWNKAIDGMSSLTWLPHAHFSAEPVACQLETGDAVVGQLGWPTIDILKLDVEGHEVDVLTGFAGTLDSSRAPAVIQFEYGMTYIPARHTLHEVYGKLGSRYAIGRLYPDGVDFKEYDAVDDHFRMGNHIAVRRDTNLSTKLSRF